MKPEDIRRTKTMAAYEFDCAVCRKHVVIPDFRGQPPKYCSVTCRKAGDAIRRRERRLLEKQKKSNFVLAEQVQNDHPLVPVQKCAKCRYSQLVGQFLCCGYFEFSGQTRTSLHPEGLTAECQEFKPRARERKKIPLTVKG